MAKTAQRLHHNFHQLHTVLCRHRGTPADPADAYPYGIKDIRLECNFCGELISIFAQSVSLTPDTLAEATCAVY
jgi:hypothetical protein